MTKRAADDFETIKRRLDEILARREAKDVLLDARSFLPMVARLILAKAYNLTEEDRAKVLRIAGWDQNTDPLSLDALEKISQTVHVPSIYASVQNTDPSPKA